MTAHTVLQVNKFFFPKGGAETALLHTRRLLNTRGHRVVDYAMQDDRNVASEFAPYFAPHREYTDPQRPKSSRLRDALESIYSPTARRRLGTLLDTVRPDVAHLHNIYHQLTLSVVDELDRRGIPIVLTLHDYKIACPAYTLFRDGQPCRLCLDGMSENVLLHRCVKGSVGGSALAAVEARMVRLRSSYGKVDVFIAPSRYAADVAFEAGVRRDRVVVLQNFLPDSDLVAPQRRDIAPRFLYAGRLEETKGLRDLLRVFAEDAGLGRLVIASPGGAMLDEVLNASEASPAIEFVGELSPADVQDALSHSRALLLPSRWPENNPLSVLEAQAAEVPVIATSVGGLPELITDGENGFLVRPGDLEALRAAIHALAGSAAEARRLGRNGRLRVMRENTEDAHYAGLLAAYEAASDMRAARGRRRPS